MNRKLGIDANIPASTGLSTATFTFSGTEQGSDAGSLTVVINPGGATTYYHQDHLSARLTTNASGGILTQEGHYPFGEQWYMIGPTNKWFFTSYDRDSESGLDYALARYYDSRTGTFCSADPLAGDPSDPQSWNRYPYGRNDPIDMTDPSGKHWWNWVLDIGLGALAGGLPAMLGADAVLADGILGGALAGGTVALRQTSGQFHMQQAKQIPVYCNQNVMDAMKIALVGAMTKNTMTGLAGPGRTSEGGFPVYQTADGVRVGNGPDGTPPDQQVQYGKAEGWKIKGRPNAIDKFHTHPDSPFPSTPNDTVSREGSDTATAIDEGIDQYVISWRGLTVARKDGPRQPGKDWDPWIVQGNGPDEWLKALRAKCGIK